MAKTVPSTLTLPELRNYLPGEDITIADWKAVNRALNYHYAHLGATVQGMVFEDVFDTTSTTYTSTPTTANHYDLDDWNGIFRFWRPMYDSADDQYSITLNAYAQNLDVRATLTRIDTAEGTTNSSTAFTTLVASTTSGDSEWVSADLTFTTAQQAIGGAGSSPAYFLVYVEVKVPSAGTGYLWSFSLRETILTAAQLPRT